MNAMKMIGISLFALLLWTVAATAVVRGLSTVPGSIAKIDQHEAARRSGSRQLAEYRR